MSNPKKAGVYFVLFETKPPLLIESSLDVYEWSGNHWIALPPFLRITKFRKTLESITKW